MCHQQTEYAQNHQQTLQRSFSQRKHTRTIILQWTTQEVKQTTDRTEHHKNNSIHEEQQSYIRYTSLDYQICTSKYIQ